MKKKMMKQMFVCLVALAMLVGWAGFGQPTSVKAASLIVTEAWELFDGGDCGEYYDLEFTVTNDGYADIREFAIGNNEAEYAWVDNNFSHSPSSLINGLLAEKVDGQWKTVIGWNENGPPIYRDLTWMDNATGFNDYTRAFLFTSWGWSDTGYDGYLEGGFTNGYCGTTAMFASPFAASSESGGTITGETSAVPIPGAIWLLGSGLMGMVVMRRRKS